MMQDGLHIGLAAWIHGKGKTDSFPAYPDRPIVTTLVNLEAIKDVADLAQAAEFARLVNFIPRQGEPADTFSASAVLWQVHRDILGQMDHATEAWTRTQEAEYQAAYDILYTTDAAGLTAPSEKHLRYQEMRSAYRDLVASGGSEEEIAEALANWVALGKKQEIEDAFEVIARLDGLSSRNKAEMERLLLNQDPPGVGLRFYGDMEFAPVYFAPISAISRETWMKAKISFTDLDRAVGNSPPNSKWPNSKWKAFLANRTGEVLFHYVVLNCLRPWYTPGLYNTDDWKLRSDGIMVSKGNGTEGLLPAYVDTVYLVSVENVTTKPKPQPPRRPKQPNPVKQRKQWDRPILILGRKSLGDRGPSMGVVKKAVNTPVRAVSASSGALPTRQLRSVQKSTIAGGSIAGGLPNQALLGSGSLLLAPIYAQRILLAQAILQGTASATTEETTSSEIYVAGFGCEKIPFAPNPNPNYTW